MKPVPKYGTGFLIFGVVAVWLEIAALLPDISSSDILTVFYAKDIVAETFNGSTDYRASGPAVIKQQIWSFEE